ncbi:MAG: hypothetical protein QQW96_24770 [Tychonema bourrellyi B0820]|nr:hypothetical protein [Tychonema bourrellyi B0820]
MTCRSDYRDTGIIYLIDRNFWAIETVSFIHNGRAAPVERLQNDDLPENETALGERGRWGDRGNPER